MSWFRKASNGWQYGEDDILGDVQRYLYDAYQARVFITNLAGKKITVSVSLYLAQFGTCVWQDFWRFDTNEEKSARECYKKVSKATSKVFDDFKTNVIPNPMIYTHLRNEVLPIFPEKRPTSRNIVLDQSRRLETVQDWRSSIYGNRYPESDGF